MSVTAFAPGHITGFFEICSADDPALAGSRGAGLCLTRGAVSVVDRHTSRTSVTVDGDPGGSVTKDAIRLLTDRPVEAQITLELPQSQGFGMSAAGTLATAIAVADLYGLPRDRAVRAAHVAEVQHATGLGDVVPSATGGIEIRETPGATGRMRHIDSDAEVVVASIGPELQTVAVLRDPAMRARISRVGRRCLEELLAEPSFERLFTLSRRFAVETGLLTPGLRQALEAIEPYGMASMCMLGNAVFATGDTDILADVLSDFGDVWTCNVDHAGARILEA